MAGCKVVAALALVLLACSPLFARGGSAPPVPPPPDPPTGDVNFYLTGVGAGNILGGVYTSPYNAVINPSLINPSTGVSTGGTPILTICDDFSDNTYIDEDWAAIATTLSSLNTASADSTLKFGDSNSLTVNDVSQATTLGIGTGATPNYGLNVTLTSQLEAYDVAALLAIDIFGITDDTADAAQLGGYSYAMWALFDTTDALQQLSNGCPGANCGTDTAAETLAIEDLYTAVNEVTTNPGAVSSELANYNVTIYSYDGNFSPSCYPGPTTCSSAPPQEFISVNSVTQVPEASSLDSLAVYFLLGGASLLFFGRRQIFKRQ
jgi:hypothetical protein